MKTSQELHRKTFELTLALYRVTDFFPQGEALKRQLREKANEIFGGVTEYGYAEGSDRGALALLAKMETVKGYLHVARSMRFVRPINLTILEREYEFLENFFRDSLRYEKNETPAGRKERSRESKSFRSEFSRYSDQTDESYKNGRPLGSSTVEAPFAPTVSASPNAAFQPDVREARMTERQKKIVDHITRVSQAQLGDLHAVLSDISAKTIQRDLHDLVARGVLKQSGQKRWTTYSIR